MSTSNVFKVPESDLSERPNFKAKLYELNDMLSLYTGLRINRSTPITEKQGVTKILNLLPPLRMYFEELRSTTDTLSPEELEKYKGEYRFTYNEKLNMINEMESDLKKELPKLQKKANLYLESLQKEKEEEKERFIETRGLKSVQEYLENVKSEESYVQSLQDTAREIFKQKGPLCDNEGFYQHSGECWSDSIQQVLLNTDEIKEGLQRLFIEGPLPDIQTLPDTVFASNEGSTDKTIIQNKKFWAEIYIREVQKRFLRHYITEGKRRQLSEALCSNEEDAVVAREKLRALSKEPSARKAGKEGKTAAIVGKIGKVPGSKNIINNASFAYSLNSYGDVGGTILEIQLLVNIFEALLAPISPFKSQRIDLRTNVEQNPAPIGIKRVPTNTTFELSFLDDQSAVLLLQYQYKESDKSFYFQGGGHETAFYKCGGQEFFYDNNSGSWPFPWKSFLKDYTNYQNDSPTIQCYRYILKKESEYYLTDYYPVLVLKDGRKLTYLENTLTEFSSTEFKAPDKSSRLSRELIFPMIDGLFFLSPQSSTEVTNTNFKFQHGLRINPFQSSKDKLILALLAGDFPAALQMISEKKFPRDFGIVTDGGTKDMIDFLLTTNLFSVDERLLLFEKLIAQGYTLQPRYENLLLGIINYVITIDSSLFPFIDLLIKKNMNLLNPSLIYSFPKTKEGATLLHLAVKYNADDTTVDYFIIKSNRALLNEKDSKDGLTPLSYAAQQNNLRIASLLCKLGADKTGALEVAESDEMKQLLTECKPPTGGSRKKRTHSNREKRKRFKTTRKHRRTL